MKSFLFLSVIFFSGLAVNHAMAKITANHSAGAVIIGAASDTCDGTTVGAIRYASNLLQFCNGTAWGNISVPVQTYQRVGSYFSSSSVGSGTTAFGALFGGYGLINGEDQRQLSVPFNGNGYNFYVVTNGTQPASGSTVATLRKNGTNTAVTITIPAGAAAGTFSDTTHTASFSSGDLLAVGFTNNSSTTISNIASFSLVLTFN